MVRGFFFFLQFAKDEPHGAVIRATVQCGHNIRIWFCTGTNRPQCGPNCDDARYVSAGHEECVRYLVEQKADVNVSDIKAQTALYVAVKNKHLKCVRILLQVSTKRLYLRRLLFVFG